MTNNHFSNTGQKLQLAVAMIALILAFINAFPALKNLDVLALSPIVFFLIMTVSALVVYQNLGAEKHTNRGSEASLSKKANSSPSGSMLPFITDRLAGGNEIAITAKGLSFNLNLGERRTFGDGTNNLSVELRSIDTSIEGKPMAEIYIDAFVSDFQSGAAVEKLSNKLFKVPAATYQEETLHKIHFSSTSLTIDLLRVDHINRYSGAAEITIVRAI